MKLHNTLTRSIDQFTPLNNNTVTLYSCGPTVYDNLTVGNWTSYIRWDTLSRAIRASGYSLDWYMNVTDVGHLVSDGDEGEDKLEKGARREGKTAWQVAEKYTDDFIKGLQALNIDFDLRHLVKATDHINEQIELIKKLEANGHTYVIDDGVYFDSTTFANYGKMARLDLEGQQAGARVDVGQKKHASDFALWKFSPKDQTRDMEWESPWGKGFPGWHIECSAMSMKYLGETIDIHTGGIDHIPVHHTNEIAQSEAATGQEFVRFWLHGNFLKVDGQKISKSLNNGYTLTDLVEKGFSPLDFKMLVLQSHYRTEANFTFEALEAAKVRLKSYQTMVDYAMQPTLNYSSTNTAAIFNAYKDQLLTAVQNDLDTPRAVAILSELESTILSSNATFTDQEALLAYSELLRFVDVILGLKLSSREDIDIDQKQLIQKRELARQNKDWAKSDELRDQLAADGIEINDTPNGARWYRS